MFYASHISFARIYTEIFKDTAFSMLNCEVELTEVCILVLVFTYLEMNENIASTDLFKYVYIDL